MSGLVIEGTGDFFKLSGTIDEYSELEKISANIDENQIKVTFDLEGISRINSTGAREWADFLRYLKCKIVYDKCANAMIEQFNMIPEVLGIGSQVLSFYVVFYCSDCDEEKYVLVKFEEGFESFEKMLPDVLCDTCIEPMEFDGDEGEYESLLKSQRCFY